MKQLLDIINESTNESLINKINNWLDKNIGQKSFKEFWFFLEEKLKFTKWNIDDDYNLHYERSYENIFYNEKQGIMVYIKPPYKGYPEKNIIDKNDINKNILIFKQS